MSGPVTVQQVLDCPQCRAYLSSQVNLGGACASVGIEHAMSTQEMMVFYMSRYHLRGHVEAPR